MGLVAQIRVRRQAIGHGKTAAERGEFEDAGNDSVIDSMHFRGLVITRVCLRCGCFGLGATS